MSNNSNNNNSNIDKTVNQVLQERREDRQLLERFKRVATNRLDVLTRQSEATGVEMKMGDQERQIFQSLQGMGIKEGIAASLLTFFVLRRGPIYVGRWVQRQRQRQRTTSSSTGGGHHSSFSSPPPPMGDSSYQLSRPTPPMVSLANPYYPRPANFILRSVWFTFDVVLSLMMGASISMSLVNPTQIREQLVQLPLLPGRSLTSEALCDDIVHELQKIQKEQPPAYRRLVKQQQTTTVQPGDDVSAAMLLDSITEFAHNCQRRRYAEQNLRLEQGLATTEAVEIRERIPPTAPRLMEDPLTIDSPEDNISMMNGMNDDGSDSQFGKDEFLQDWVEKMVDDDNNKDTNNSNEKSKDNTPPPRRSFW